MTEAIAGENATISESTATPAELAERIDASLKTLLVLIGQSMQAKRRLVSNVRSLQLKAATTNSQTKEELIILQQYQNGYENKIPGLKVLEAECVRYDFLVKELSRWITSAKDALIQELEVARTREELERVENDRKQREAEVERLKEEEKKLIEETQKKEDDAIVVDDDEDDDVPLANREGKSAETTAASINSTSGGPQAIETDTALSANQAMNDPAALLAALTANTSSDQTKVDSSMALDNFDFSQLDLQNMSTAGGTFGSLDQGNNFGTDPLDFSMDFLDYNTMDTNEAGMAGGGGMVDTSALFGNIDFGALLGNNTEVKKE